jgi:hypothetical protein
MIKTMIVLFLHVWVALFAFDRHPNHGGYYRVLDSSKSTNGYDSVLTAVGTLASGNVVMIHYSTIPFDTLKHKCKWKLTNSKNKNDKWFDRELLRIDGHKPIGTDGGIPATELDTLQIWINGKQIPISKSRYSNLYNFDWDNDDNLSFSEDVKGIHINKWASDGAGAYSVEIIVKALTIRNIITESLD